MLDPQDIAYLVVHCSDTPDDAALTGRDIHQMHLGFGWGWCWLSPGDWPRWGG